MSINPTADSSQETSPVSLKPTAIAAIFLGLHVLPLFWQPNPLWSVDFLSYLPAPVQALFVLLSVLLFVPGFRRQVRAAASTLPLSLWGRGRSVRITRVLLLFVALAAFVALSSARHFLGDGYHVLEKLDAETWHDAYRAPFTYTVIGTLHRLGSALWETAENTYRVYSYVSGILYVLISIPVAAVFGKNALEKSIVLAFLLTTGYMQQFFGYVENYAVYLPGLLIYILLGLRTLEQRMPLFVTALALGMLVAFHRVLAIFGPSLLFLAYHDFRRRQGSISTGRNILATTAAFCCVPLSTALFLTLSGVGFDAYVGRTGSGEFLPLFQEPGFYAQYRMFSFPHLVDFVNLRLLSAPAACLALFLMRKRILGRHAFLVLCAIVPLFFTLIAKANIGAFRDWDILSLPALPLTLLAAAAVLERIPDREQRFHTACLVCGAAALHTVLWIGLNASAGPAEARFTSQLGRLTGHASATGWITMGKYHGDQDNPAAAIEAYKRALETDPANANHWMIVGAVYREMGKSASAIEFYEKAAELLPDHAVSYMNLGAAFSDLGQFDKAIAYTRKAIAIQPGNATVHQNLGAMYRMTGQVAKAIEHLEIAVALRHDQAAAHGNLGNTYREAGNNAKAIAHFEKSIALRPRDTAILVNLSVAYIDEGHVAKAIEALKKAVEIQPDHFTAYLNLGVVHSRIGEYATGMTYFKKSLEIQPDHPVAHKNLGLNYRAQGLYKQAIEHLEKTLESPSGGRDVSTYLDLGNTYYDVGRHEEAVLTFQRAVELNPNHANAHLLLGLTYQKLKRGDRAKVHFEKTLELEPEHPQADQIKLWIKGVGEGRL